jgi:hypothetical protein
MTKRSSKQEFITKAKNIHGDLYDYSDFVYSNSKTKSTILCKKHNLSFEQKPNGHLSGDGCPRCSKTQKLNKETFVLKAREIHKDLYDYSEFVKNTK